MPCRNDWPDEELNRREREGAFTKAALCALLTAVNNAGFDPLAAKSQIIIDWAEAGVTRKQMAAWWKQHKLEDERRREREAEQERIKKLKQEALAKLTAEEKAILGVK